MYISSQGRTLGQTNQLIVIHQVKVLHIYVFLGAIIYRIFFYKMQYNRRDFVATKPLMKIGPKYNK